MDRNQVTCESNDVVSEIVQQSGINIHENDPSTTKFAAITDDNEPDIDGSMESNDLEISPIEISCDNDTTMEKKKELDSTEAAASPTLIQHVESNKTVVLSSESNSPKPEETMKETIHADGHTIEKTQLEKPVTSLSVIALAYDNSDSESEQVECVYEEKNLENVPNEMEIQITNEYRNIPSTLDEDSDDSSSDSSDESSSDVESIDSDCSEKNSKKSINTKKNEKKNCNSRYAASQEKESKSEFDSLPPIEELKISVPEVLCDPLGEIAWTVEQMVVVRPKAGKPTLNLDTILFVERGRRVLGRIFDVFGQVSDPHYCVRFNSSEHIKECDIKVGMTAYFCPNTEYTSVVFVQDLLKMKATDELGDDEPPEFSDDEEEQAYYAVLKQKQKGEKAKTGEEVPQKRQRTDPGWKSNHPWSSGRKQEQSKKPEKNYNSPGWSGTPQQNVRSPANLWQQYPPAYPNVSWSSASESYQGNAWRSTCPSQNSYNYSATFENQHPPRNSRPFFRPQHSFQSVPVPYMQNGHYSRQPNPPRYPGINFPWQSPVPQQHPVSWCFSSPPPPPPPPGM